MISNCCGATMKGEWLDVEMCPDCGEHCEAEEDDGALTILELKH